MMCGCLGGNDPPVAEWHASIRPSPSSLPSAIASGLPTWLSSPLSSSANRELVGLSALDQLGLVVLQHPPHLSPSEDETESSVSTYGRTISSSWGNAERGNHTSHHQLPTQNSTDTKAEHPRSWPATSLQTAPRCDLWFPAQGSGVSSTPLHQGVRRYHQVCRKRVEKGEAFRQPEPGLQPSSHATSTSKQCGPQSSTSASPLYHLG